MKWGYLKKSFNKASLIIINQANTIIEEYTSQGYSLTLRQLYYQFVSRDIIPNTVRWYGKLGSIINNARLAGEIDWNAIEDRTRNLKRPSFWNSPADIMQSVVNSYKRDLWAGQNYRPEVWIEKDALIGVIEPICTEFRLPSFSCRGYVSQSEMWAAGQRFVNYYRQGQTPIIIHLGDHDPSGLDMSRDIQERVTMFLRGHVLGVDAQVKRIALNMDQIKKYMPPPNPAKTTDSRFREYMKEYGDESWELDALSPDVLCSLIRKEIKNIRIYSTWKSDKLVEEKEIQKLDAVRLNFEKEN